MLFEHSEVRLLQARDRVDRLAEAARSRRRPERHRPRHEGNVLRLRVRSAPRADHSPADAA